MSCVEDPSLRPTPFRMTQGSIEVLFIFFGRMLLWAAMSTFTLSSPGPSSPRSIDYHKELNQEQLEVVLHGDGACLVLAGAGSGKTRTLTHRVAYLLEQGVDPSSILLLTFTNKAAKEMMARVASLSGCDARGLWGGTFHSISNRLLRSFADQLGYTTHFSILDADDAGDLLKAVMKDLKIDPKARRFPSVGVVGSLISLARNTQQPLVTVLQQKHPHFLACLPDLETIAKDYQTRKKSANVLDFDDLLSLMAVVLEHEAWGRSIAECFRYVLVDEYQDTNALQARMVKGFARVHQQILVVGDDAQSIYAFRGADVQNILSFPTEWPGARMFKLVTNYRSTPEILAVANASLGHNLQQFEKELVAVCGQGDRPKLIPCRSAAQEARYVADQILLLRSEGVALRNMAVLFRSSAHSQALEFELIKRDVPYEYRGGQKFFERAHIKDVVAFLRAYQNPKDELAWFRVLALQPGIGAGTASVLTKQLVHVSSFEQALSPEMRQVVSARAEGGWQRFTTIAGRMLEGNRSPGEMIRALISSPYQDYLEQEYPNWRERLEDLEQLSIFAENYADTGAFLADIALYDEILGGRKGAEVPRDSERMVLSTVHQAKGLEWDTVFIIHLAETCFPNRRALEEQDGMEEERRLFYVAVTRARRRLFLSYPITAGFDGMMLQQPSTFLEEVSPGLFDRVRLQEMGSPSVGSIGGSRGPSSGRRGSWDGGWEEPTIVLDGSGERVPLPPQNAAPRSFLRDVDEL